MLHNFMRCMPILVGDGTPKEELLEQIKSSRRILTSPAEEDTDQIILDPKFRMAETPQCVLTVVVTPAMLGFDNIGHNARRRKVLDPELWQAWSAEHIPGYCLDWCPHEVALRMPLQYRSTGKAYEHFVIATEPIVFRRMGWMFSFGNFLDAFEIQTFGAAEFPLSEYDQSVFHHNLEFIFQLRKL